MVRNQECVSACSTGGQPSRQVRRTPSPTITAFQDTSAPGCASAESAPLPIRLHHAVQQQHALGSGIGPKLIDRRSQHASASRGIVTFIAGRNRRDFFDPSHVQTSAQSRADLACLPRGRFIYSETRIAADDSATRGCAPVEVATFPRRLRRCKAHAPTPCETTATARHRFHQLVAPTAAPQEPPILRHPDRIKALRHASVSSPQYCSRHNIGNRRNACNL